MSGGEEGRRGTRSVERRMERTPGSEVRRSEVARSLRGSSSVYRSIPGVPTLPHTPADRRSASERVLLRSDLTCLVAIRKLTLYCCTLFSSRRVTILRAFVRIYVYIFNLFQSDVVIFLVGKLSISSFL